MNPKVSFLREVKVMTISVLLGLGIWLLSISIVSVLVLNKAITLHQTGYAGMISMVISTFIMAITQCKKQIKNKIIFVIIGTAVMWLIMYLIGKGSGSGSMFLGAILPMVSGSAAAVILSAKPKKKDSFKYNKNVKW